MENPEANDIAPGASDMDRRALYPNFGRDQTRARQSASDDGDLFMNYQEFLSAKVRLESDRGVLCTEADVHPVLKPHQRAMVAWAVNGGRRAIFAAFGLGKSLIQLETVRLCMTKSGSHRGLIVCPLGVKQEFIRDAKLVGLSPTFVRSSADVGETGIYLTNYESVREGKIDPTLFDVVSLDEAAVLRGFGGTKTFREFMAIFAGDDRRGGTKQRVRDVPYRFVATATPSPNDYIELLAYAAYLGVMEVGEAKTRFFKRNSEKADQLTIHPHKENEFWLWVASWALFVQKPSDLGFSDEGYALPDMVVRWHEIETDHATALPDKFGQGQLLKSSAIGVQQAAREKRDTLHLRIAKMMELRAEDPLAHRVIWHDLEDERRAIEEAIPDVVSVYGAQKDEQKESAVLGFSSGTIRELAGKPVMIGAGTNLQHHCHRAIFLGIGFKFADFIQAVHRVYRFGQQHKVIIDLIYTEAEREVKAVLVRKWEQHNAMVAKMQEIIHTYGLSAQAMEGAMTRSMGLERREASGETWKLVNNDSVLECDSMDDNSVGLILTSIPFGTQYEYSPSFNDFGHTDDNDHFWRQMDYLTPNLLRVLEPGRIMAIHVKDRVTPSGITGRGYQTVAPFHSEAINHYMRHGFGYLGMKTIVTDVVRENAQTYRLGWSEQCKDGSRMGVGMPEYLLLFRKDPTDTGNGYADVPVVKSKDAYTRARWQFDAHGFARSSGNRLIAPEDFDGLTHRDLFRLFRKHSLNEVYDFETDVAIAEAVDRRGYLPPSFMLLQPQSWHPDVWTDIARMRTSNMVQAQKGREQHVCPMQWDICDRAIVQYTNPGDVVFDPFSGLGTTAMRAVLAGRIGWGCELCADYWEDSIAYVRGAQDKVLVPGLFDLIELEDSCDDLVEECV